MAKLQKIYIDDIANLTQTMLERASKKHKSVNAYCIFVEGDHYHALIPEYESAKEKEKEIQNPEICDAFAKFVVPPARFHERNAKVLKCTRK